MDLAKTPVALVATGFALCNFTSWALPTLQLDIPGGSFNTVDETTYSSGPVFTLRALLNGSVSDPPGPYYVSAAITPRLDQTTPAPAFGSFSINGVTCSVANGNIYYGDPPVNVVDGLAGNLATHGIFPTYYAEVPFDFDVAHHVAAYNTNPNEAYAGTGILYYHDFAINVTGLTPGYSVHFDLYDEAVRKKSGSYTIDDFAPFSHDAQSGNRSVPDSGSTIALLGGAVAGVNWMRRKVSKD